MCENRVTKTFDKFVQIKMANFTYTPKCLPLGVIVAKISALVKISGFAKDSCVDDCAYILETVPIIQDHSLEASCSEDADLFLLWEELKLNELNLNEEEKKAVHEIITACDKSLKTFCVFRQFCVQTAITFVSHTTFTQFLLTIY